MKYGAVSTKPVKRFFVEMLTRDIALEDAILDLLDNCVDGILRSLEDTRKAKSDEKPYEGFHAEINFTAKEFAITDNCGGIPWSEHGRAFRMGKPPNGSDEPALTVGVYGIGMKRAIFKIGREGSIWTQNRNNHYKVVIPRGWMENEETWDLEVDEAKEKMAHDGTTITVKRLAPGVSDRFAAESFQDDLLDKIQSHYAVIIRKGFQVQVNGVTADPKPIQLRFLEPDAKGEGIRPYIFKSRSDGVSVFLAVGLREPIPGVERILQAQSENIFSADYAGWTVICNDRVVLYCNRDQLTGWGTAGVPAYHNQFIAISGVVEFEGDPRKLPTTTTKRGLEFSSPLYQQVLDRMRDGVRLFIDFTNKWKAREDEAKGYVMPVPAIDYPSLKRAAGRLKFSKVKVGLEGEQYRPHLPLPRDEATDVRIAFRREKADVTALAEEILKDFEAMPDREIPKRVGEASFDFAFDHYVNGRKPRRRK